MEQHEMPLPIHSEFFGKNYLLRVFYDGEQKQFPSDSLEPRALSSLGISAKGIQRAIVYAYFDRKKVTRVGSGEAQPYWEGGVYAYKPHYERELRKVLREKKE